jgi:uncharacterized membrane protein
MLTDGRRAEATVPLDKFVALSVVRFAPDTAPNKPDHVPVVIVPTLVSDDVTILGARVVPTSVLALIFANAVFSDRVLTCVP